MGESDEHGVIIRWIYNNDKGREEKLLEFHTGGDCRLHDDMVQAILTSSHREIKFKTKYILSKA